MFEFQSFFLGRRRKKRIPQLVPTYVACASYAAIFIQSLCPHTVNAAFDADNGYYLLDEIEAKAPGAATPESLHVLNPIDYYAWTMLITPNPNLFSQKEYKDGTVAEFVTETLEAIAFEESGTTAEELEDSPEAQTKYNAKARELFEMELNETAAGPFQKHIWDWYLTELDYERNHADKVAAFKLYKEKWMRDWVALKQFERAYPMPNIIEHSIFMNANQKLGMHIHTRKEFKSSKIDKDDSNPSLSYGQFLWHNREMEATYQTAKANWKKNSEERGDIVLTISPAHKAAAQKAYNTALARLEANPFFRPDVSTQLDHVKATKGGKNPYWYDVSCAYLQTLQIENDSNINVRDKATIGFDSYAIIDEPIESVLAAYLYRVGRPIEGMPESGTATIYPNDNLFQYRRDQSWSREAFWGPNTLVNHSIKWQAKSTFIADLSDAYLLLLRGSKEKGYHLIIQFLGPFCPVDARGVMGAGVEDRHCSTEVQSSFTILILKPNGPKQTLYKMSSRTIGQNQEVAQSRDSDRDIADWLLTGASKFLNMINEHSRREYGFNVDHFSKSHDSFLRQSAMVTNGRKAIAAGTKVIHLHSQDGYYIKGNEVKKFNSASAATSAGFASVAKEQGIYLVDGRLIRLADERGSDNFRAKPSRSWDVTDVK